MQGSSSNFKDKKCQSQTTGSNNQQQINKLSDQLEDLYLECPVDVKDHIGKEIFLLAAKVQKYNKYVWRNERMLALTQESLMFLKKKDLRRKIALRTLAGVTMSMDKESNELVIHVQDEADIRMSSKKHRKQIMDSIKMFFAALTKQNLPIYGVRQKNLGMYTTQDNDVQKGISRIPLELARIAEEDLVKIDFDDPTSFNDHLNMTAILMADEENELRVKYINDGAPNVQIMEDLNQTFEYRVEAREKSLVSSGAFSDFSDLDLTMSQNGEQSVRLYTRSSEKDKITFLEDFQCIHQIGRGAFGKVYLIYLKNQNRYFAMKSMRKDLIIDTEQMEGICMEQLVMCQVNHPFIVNMQYVFQRDFRIYFVMDYIKGGELFQYMREERRFSEERVVFYSAQIALALGYVHKSKILYRDLKPENILLDEFGYIKLADFGIAKQAIESNTFCGSPEYISPEMIQGTGHDHTLDWWALGTLIYEMLVGVPPYYDKNQHKMFTNIENAELQWPEQDKHGFSVSPIAKDFIKKLLVRDRKKRLGYKNDSKDILAHGFFKNINIKKLINKELKAPYKPEVQDMDQVKNSNKLIKFKNFTESVVSEQSKQIVHESREMFAQFGTNVDMTMEDKIKQMQQDRQMQQNWQRQRAQEDMQEENKPNDEVFLNLKDLQ